MVSMFPSLFADKLPPLYLLPQQLKENSPLGLGRRALIG